MSTEVMEPSRYVRDHFAEVIERDQTTIITRHGREIAAVVPIAELRYYEQLEARELHRMIEQRRPEIDQPRHSFDDVLRETLARSDDDDA